jgi:hypothetical protein
MSGFDDTDENIIDRLNECADLDAAEGGEPSVVALTRESAVVIENLTSLINRLCRQLNRIDPGNDVAVKAAEYMHRSNLLGVSLRRDDEGIAMVMDMVRNQES